MKRMMIWTFVLMCLGMLHPQAISAQKVEELTLQTFNQKVAKTDTQDWKFLGKRPAIIDFYATWCGPCKKMSPILSELAKEYAGKIDIYKVDVDKERDLATLFGIRSLPTLLFIPLNGQPAMTQGALPKEDLKKAIDEVLLKK